MRDRETGTIWTHLDGKAIAGPLEGERLQIIAVPHMTWGEWKADHPPTVGNQQKWDTFVKERSGGNGSVVGLPEQVVVAFAAG